MEDTGWRELIDIGWNCLVDDDTNLIVEKALNHHPISKLDSLLYGSGDAGEKIAGILYVE
jgi:UDP-N-acetylglucosamine 2-epimerase